MPELPEVETTARGLRERIVGLRVRSVGGVDWPRMVPNSSEAELQEVLCGLRVKTVDRKGKYLLVEFEQDRWLTIHRKMSGNLLLRTPDAAPEAHTHLEIGFDDRNRAALRRCAKVRPRQPVQVVGGAARFSGRPSGA